MSQIDDLLKVANITEDEILNGVEPGDDIITLRSANGEDVDFIEIAGIAHEGKFYLILQPVELLECMDDDEAFVFEVKAKEDGNSDFEIVLDEAIIDAVFAEYGKLYEQAVADGEDN